MTKKVAWNVRQQLSTRWHVPLTFKTYSWIFPNRSLTFVQILRTTFGSETAMSAITPFHAWISSSSKIFKYSIITHLLLFISKQISLSLSLCNSYFSSPASSLAHLYCMVQWLSYSLLCAQKLSNSKTHYYWILLAQEAHGVSWKRSGLLGLWWVVLPREEEAVVESGLQLITLLQLTQLLMTTMRFWVW